MDDILAEVLGHIRLVSDNKQKLQKILDFILDEIYEEPEEEIMKIPKEFEKLLNPIAQSVDCGLVCYLNTDTLETEEIPKDMDMEPEDYELEFEDNDWVEPQKYPTWENFIRIEPLESIQSFKIMESFANSMEDKKFQEQLLYALNNRKPFANFKWKVDNSPYRQNWFDFKQKWIEGYVREEIHYYFSNHKDK